ncbi:MAG: CBS domain-containing protein [Deltaproteobacteria bacterium]|nr:CBS domain-containing protein [Deltaproteobacteria bacterium]
MDSSAGTERLETVRVGDIMIPVDAYPKVLLWSTLREAVELMEKARLDLGGRISLPRVLLVFGADGALVGTVRRRDIMRGLEPRFLVSRPLDYRKKLFDVDLDPNLSELSHERLVRDVREQAKTPVSEVMRPVASTVDVGDHILKAIYEMVSNNVSLLPVLRGGKVVGVVRSVEMLHEVAGLVL